MRDWLAYWDVKKVLAVGTSLAAVGAALINLAQGNYPAAFNSILAALAALGLNGHSTVPTAATMTNNSTW